ncbi:MAG: zf-HC2 domain-containing protein [Syntrophomonadaceae bacterium]
MNCDTDKLQMYLDGELNTAEKAELERHLGSCPHCRREIGQLKLLWLELGEETKISVPAELPFLRQQLIYHVLHQNPGDYSGLSYWKSQKQVWQPFLWGARQIPGLSLIPAAGRQLPKLLRGTASLVRDMGLIPGLKRGGSR